MIIKVACFLLQHSDILGQLASWQPVCSFFVFIIFISVFINIFDTAIASGAVPIANCEPPLNPNQPNHRINIQIVTKAIEDAAKGFIGAASPLFVNLPNLGPSNNTPAKAAAPPVE